MTRLDCKGRTATGRADLSFRPACRLSREYHAPDQGLVATIIRSPEWCFFALQQNRLVPNGRIELEGLGNDDTLPCMARAGTDNAGTRHLFGHDHYDIDVLNRQENARRNEEDKPTDMLGAS
jgi:hypothetical protein